MTLHNGHPIHKHFAGSMQIILQSLVVHGYRQIHQAARDIRADFTCIDSMSNEVKTNSGSPLASDAASLRAL
jgi:hypothetical protein